MIDERLQYTKYYSWILGLYLNDGVFNEKKIFLGDGLEITSQTKEKEARKKIKKYINKNFNIGNSNSVILKYIYSGEKNKSFEGERKVNRFITAVKVFYGCECVSMLGLPAIKKKLLNVHDFSEFPGREEVITDVIWRGKKITISSNDEIKDLKKIYKNLGVVNIENDHMYSPLHNSIKFYEHAYDTKWTLLKVTLLFISLESLFNERAEITYKIALRVSKLIYPDNQLKRKEVFEFIKNGYKVRHSFVHGSDPYKDAKKVTSKIESKRELEYYGFHDDFPNELSKIVTDCLKAILLDDELTKIFLSLGADEEKNDFLDNLLLD
jgi:hypothetical protein